MSKTSHRKRSDTSETTDDTAKLEEFNDVTLIVQGKTIRANAAILAYNSSVLGDLITDAQKHGGGKGEFGDIGSTKVLPETPRRKLGEPVEVEIKDQSYNAVKTMMAFLQTKFNKDDPLSGETAIQLLPMVETYKMSKLRRKCVSAMLSDLQAMKSPEKVGFPPTSTLLKYLAAADKHNLERVKKLCIEECAANHTVTARKDIVDDKHISDKSKVAILDKMCDQMPVMYDKKLDDMLKEMHKRNKELEKNRQSYVKEMQEWRTDFDKEVEDVIKTKSYKQLYEHLLEQIKEVRTSVDQSIREVNALRTQVLNSLEPLEGIDPDIMACHTVAEDASVSREVFEKTCKDTNTNMKKISDKSNEYFKEALKNFEVGLFQTSLAGSYELQLKNDDLTTEIEDKTQEVSELAALYEREKTQHDRTKVQLMKQLKKVHQINTWMKWAKPADEDENKCTCFRHDAPKRQFLQS